MLVQRPRNEIQLQATDTAPNAAKLVQHLTKYLYILLQSGSSAHRFFGRWIRAISIAGVILARQQPNTSNTAQTLLQTQVHRSRCAMEVQLTSDAVGWPRT